MDLEEGIRRRNGMLILMGLEDYVIEEENEEENKEKIIEEIKTLADAIETLNEAGEFLNEAEDRLEEKADDESMGLIETAYIEISDVLGYLNKLNKENK